MLWAELLSYLLGLHTESVATIKPVYTNHEVIEQVEEILEDKLGIYIPTYEILFKKVVNFS